MNGSHLTMALMRINMVLIGPPIPSQNTCEDYDCDDFDDDDGSYDDCYDDDKIPSLSPFTEDVWQAIQRPLKGNTLT